MREKPGVLISLEMARQALEEAGDDGLSSRQIMEAGGRPVNSSGGGSTQAFLAQLTRYCALYESDDGRRYYLDIENDETFDRYLTVEPADIFNEEES